MKKLSILLLSMLLLLTGCQLARPDAETGQPRLVGILVTPEHLDLFDWEGYLNDNLSSLGTDGIVDGDTSAYEGRLYAQLEPETLTDENGGTSTCERYVFPDVDGIGFFAPQMSREGTKYIYTQSDDRILDGHSAINSTDDGDSITLTCSIWMAYTGEAATCYFNPVYQDADGRVYALTGHGFSSDSAMSGTFTQTLTDTQTTTENGQVKTNSTSVEITVGAKLPPECYVLIEMDENNLILRQEQFQPGQLPEEWTVSAGTAYLLLETRNQDGSVSRDLYNPDNETFQTLTRQDDFLAGHDTRLNWPE